MKDIRVDARSLMLSVGEVKYSRIEIPHLRIYNNAHSLFIQGMPLTQVFLAAEIKGPNIVIPGPLIFVCGSCDELWKVPFAMHKVVLAKLLVCPEKVTLPEIQLAFFNAEVVTNK